MKIGQKIHLNIRGIPEQLYTIVFIGPYTVKVEDETGHVYSVKKTKIRFYLYGPRKDSTRASTSVDAISVPIGSQPKSKK